MLYQRASWPSVILSVHFGVAAILILAKCGHFFLAAVHPKSKVEFASMMMVPTITKNGLTVCRE
jgi:formate dehydrogenase subunit gamma